MPLESGTTIADLNANNPASSDGLGQADDHLRLIKKLIKDTFPNINAVVTATAAQINQLVSGSVGFASGAATTPSVFFSAEPALGFYRPSAGVIAVSQGKRLSGNGAIPVGSLHEFPKVPSSILGTVSVPGTKFEFLELNGALYLIADYPDLAAYLGTTFGGNGTTTFGVPNLSDTGRFTRSRTGSLLVGTSQANVLKSHTHTASSGNAGAHGHTINDPTHSHNIINEDGPIIVSGSFSGVNTAGVGGRADGDIAIQASATGITINGVGDHAHTVTVNATGDTETRPESFVVVKCIKT